MSLPTLNVVGAGRAAGTLATALVAAGLVRIGQVTNRGADSTARAAARLGGEPADLGALAPADWWLLGVPDDRLEPVTEALARRFGTAGDHLALHLSGALPAGVLAPFALHRASFHPVRAFPRWLEDPASLRDTHVGIEGTAEAVRRLHAVANHLAMRPFTAPADRRASYHAACSLASNFAVALAAEAEALFLAAGLTAPAAGELAGELLAQSARNVQAVGPAQALTGPIARGDAGTVARQLAAVPPAQRPLYLALARATLALARAGGRLDRRKAAAIEAVLDADNGELASNR